MTPQASSDLYDRLQRVLADEPSSSPNVLRRLELDTHDLEAIVGLVRTMKDIADLDEPLGPSTVPAARQCHYIKNQAREALVLFGVS